jgi:hypothetical protein
MKDIIKYLKDVGAIVLSMLGILLAITIVMCVTVWDISMFEGDRFFNDHTYSMFRGFLILSSLLGLMMRIRVTLNFK